MDSFATFKRVTRRTIPATPEAAGLPSDAEVAAELTRRVLRTRAADDEPRFGVTGDGDFDPYNRAALARLRQEIEAFRLAHDPTATAAGALAVAEVRPF